MARLMLPTLTGKVMAIMFLAFSIFLAVFLDADVEPKRCVDAGPDSMTLMQGTVNLEEKSCEQAPTDTDTFMQGKILVNRDLSDREIREEEVKESDEKQSDRIKKFENELDKMVKESEAPVHYKPDAKRSAMALAGQKVKDTIMRLAHKVGVRSSTGAVVMIVAICVIGLLCMSSILFAWPLGGGGQSSRDERSGQSQKNIAAALEQRERMLAHTVNSPLGGARDLSGRRPGAYPSGASLTGAALYTRGESPPNSAFLPDPSRGGPAGPPSLASVPDVKQTKPPPLCPTLVMPMSEALLGIQMYELAQLSQEGCLSIVGISGKPLLRAEVKKVGETRSLEIAMPEPNSIPRASIGTPTGNGREGAGNRALEIRGMRGTFYGILEMRSSGACYVVKDGITVLSIDGDAESLQLSLKSSIGVQLASVRCGTEQFDGVDHVEVRVEPGVDTVLVISVVLAVLLLSPYLPAGDD